ncbi:MAG TPA: hypothetical protein VH539_04660 [Gemmatimonadaceae bacterium]|jgi:hypothetical protein
MRAQDRRLLGAAASSVWLSLAALYLWCPVHRFPPARPFAGRRWYNPYGSVTPATPWQKVNLHAHARAWSGLTNGRGSADDVLRSYRAMGYDAAPVSNYQAITRASGSDSTALTVYEQGYNLRKVHFLAVGPRRVDWLDYPLLQGRDEEQHRIDRIRASAALVIIAHPRLRNGLPDADLRALTGYTAIEIGSYASKDEDAWNVALDAGRPVWAVANDDTHSADEPNEAGEYWSMIAAPAVDATSLQGALATGRAYAVFGHAGSADIALRSLSVSGDTLSVAFAGAPADLGLVGPKGRLLGEEKGRREARWVLPCDAPWVRVVARTATTQLFLQPVLRSEDGALPRRVEASVAWAPTFVRRVMALVLVFIAVLSWVSHDAGSLTSSETIRRRPKLTLQDAA